MKLVKGGEVMFSDNENVISAYKEAGYIEEAEADEEKPTAKPRATRAKK